MNKRQAGAADREPNELYANHHQHHHHKSFTWKQDEGTESVRDTQNV